MAREDIGHLPSELQGPAEDLQGAISEATEAVNDVGATEVEIAGPEEIVSGFETGDGDTGAPKRRIRFPSRKAHKVPAKRAAMAPGGGGADLGARIQRAEQAISKMGTTWNAFLQKAKRAMSGRLYSKGASTGNRAVYCATVANVAAAATGTSTAIVGNADIEYDRIAFLSNTPGLFTALTAALNPIIEGSASIPADAGRIVGPFELSEPVKLNGNGGVTVSFTNRGAAAGDASVIFIPKGYAFGQKFPLASLGR